MEFPGSQSDERTLARTCEDQRSRDAGGPQLANEAESGLSRVLCARRLVGNDHGQGSCRGQHRSVARDDGVEVLDRPRLLDVEGLAPGHPLRGIDQPHLGHAASVRQLVRGRAAERPGPDDCDDRHSGVNYSSCMSTLSGRVALVTGGTRGIGAAIVESLAAAGASVVSTSRSGGAWTGSVRTIAADVRKPGAAAAAVEECVKVFGGLDILINNAGVGLFSPVADMSIEQWHDVIDTNLNGVFYCCHAAIPQMRKRGGGWIINISSLAGKNPFVGGAAYCASKGGRSEERRVGKECGARWLTDRRIKKPRVIQVHEAG